MNKPHLFSRIYSNKINLFLCLTAYICLEFFILGPFSFIELHDSLDYFFSRLPVIRNHLLNFGLSNWYPNIGCGVDRLTNDMLHFNITAILFSLFPGWLAYQIIVLTQIFIAGYFTFKLCKDSLKLNEVACIFGGIYAALFCLQFLNLRFAVSGLPFALWWLEKILNKETRNPLFKIILLGILCGASLSFVRIPFFLTVVFLWFLIIKNDRRPKFLLFFLLFSASLSLCHIFDFLAIYFNAPYSNRGSIEYNELFSHIPELFIHFKKMPIILILLLMTLTAKKTNHIVWRFVSLFSFFFIASILIGFLEYYLNNHLGKLKGFNLNRFIYYLELLCAFTGAACMDYLSGKNKKWFKAVVTLGFCILFIQSLLFKRDHATVWITNRNYIGHFKSDVIQSLSEKKDGNLFRVTTITRNMTPDTAHPFGLESVDGVSQLYSQRYKSFWSKVIEPLTQKDEFINNYFNNYGSFIHLFKPTDLNIKEIPFNEYYRLNLLSLANTRYIISRIPIEDGRLTPVFEQEKSWADLSNKEKIKINLKSNFKGNNYLYVYENKSYFPRFFLTPSVKTFDSLDALYDQLSKASLEDIRRNVYLEKKFTQTSFKHLKTYQSSKIDVVTYSPDYIELNVQLDGEGIFVSSHNYSPFWVCTVGNKKRDIIPAYGTFSGVYLTKGNHNITFRYNPPYKLAF